ncbi:hypothetical protein OS493_024970 [Desmophyllum pertusum]|uniref:VWFA domain-containing protein n=1 Tax=Desmophyllum pertusum TaxID=174260 RepID=A0A9X0CJH5_9CNID|nr:hypothetical protein OS493_024970 [Desmophyllum pertusum]
MLSLKIFLVLLLVVCSHCFIWESTKRNGVSRQSRLQKVPKERVTAKKIERFFIQPNPRRHRRNTDQTYYDVVLVFDASNSIRKRDFNKGIKALESLVDKASPDTHYAAIMYSDKATVAFTFTDPVTAKRNLHTKVRFMGDKTNTQDAFQKCRTELFLNKNSNLRPRAKNAFFSSQTEALT